MTLVHNFLEHSASQVPDKLALICGKDRITHKELDNMANRFANALLDLGLQRGDRVVVYLQNSVELVVGIMGIMKAGGVFVPVGTGTTIERLQTVIKDSAAFATMCEVRNADALIDIADKMPSVQHTILCGRKATERVTDGVHAYDSFLEQYSADKPSVQIIDQDLACLLYTSGSTGDPKGVMCAHSNMVFVSDSVIEYLENTSDDILCCTLPLAFGYGLYQAFMAFRFCGTLVLEKSFAFPAAVLKRMQDEKVTGIPIVPTIVATLLNMDLSHYDLSSLRYVTNAAAALPPEHVRRFNEYLPDVTIFCMYGLTETKRALYLPPQYITQKPDSVGIAIPGTEVWLVEHDGPEKGKRITEPGKTGELVVRGRHVMRGYWRNPEKTAARFPEGDIPGERVCHTGDLFKMDEDGHMFFVSRTDDVAKVGGEKVAPYEIEVKVTALEEVQIAAAIGVPDEILGEVIKLFVVLKEGAQLTEDDIIKHCRKNLEEIKVPRYIEFLNEMPKNERGKVNKLALSRVSEITGE